MIVDGVDGTVDASEERSVYTNVQVSGGVEGVVDGVDGRNENYVHPQAHARARSRTCAAPDWKQASTPSTVYTSSAPRISGGRAVVDGVEHVMRVAKVTRLIGRRLGLSTNHHVRVWCECMDDPVSPPGTWAGMDATVVNERSMSEAAADPRRLGSYDHLGVADMRIPNSALDVFRAHLVEVSNARTD